jgi:hypothetical protein
MRRGAPGPRTLGSTRRGPRARSSGRRRRRGGPAPRGTARTAPRSRRGRYRSTRRPRSARPPAARSPRGSARAAALAASAAPQGRSRGAALGGLGAASALHPCALLGSGLTGAEQTGGPHAYAKSWAPSIKLGPGTDVPTSDAGSSLHVARAPRTSRCRRRQCARRTRPPRPSRPGTRRPSGTPPRPPARAARRRRRTASSARHWRRAAPPARLPRTPMPGALGGARPSISCMAHKKTHAKVPKSKQEWLASSRRQQRSRAGGMHAPTRENTVLQAHEVSGFSPSKKRMRIHYTPSVGTRWASWRRRRRASTRSAAATTSWPARRTRRPRARPAARPGPPAAPRAAAPARPGRRDRPRAGAGQQRHAQGGRRCVHCARTSSAPRHLPCNSWLSECAGAPLIAPLSAPSLDMLPNPTLTPSQTAPRPGPTCTPWSCAVPAPSETRSTARPSESAQLSPSPPHTPHSSTSPACALGLASCTPPLRTRHNTAHYLRAPAQHAQHLRAQTLRWPDRAARAPAAGVLQPTSRARVGTGLGTGEQRCADGGPAGDAARPHRWAWPPPCSRLRMAGAWGRRERAPGSRGPARPPRRSRSRRPPRPPAAPGRRTRRRRPRACARARGGPRARPAAAPGGLWISKSAAPSKLHSKGLYSVARVYAKWPASADGAQTRPELQSRAAGACAVPRAATPRPAGACGRPLSFQSSFFPMKTPWRAQRRSSARRRPARRPACSRRRTRRPGRWRSRRPPRPPRRRRAPPGARAPVQRSRLDRLACSGRLPCPVRLWPCPRSANLVVGARVRRARVGLSAAAARSTFARQGGSLAHYAGAAASRLSPGDSSSDPDKEASLGGAPHSARRCSPARTRTRRRRRTARARSSRPRRRPRRRRRPRGRSRAAPRAPARRRRRPARASTRRRPPPCTRRRGSGCPRRPPRLRAFQLQRAALGTARAPLKHLACQPSHAAGRPCLTRVHGSAPARGAPAQLPEQAPHAPRLHTCSAHAPVLQAAATGAGGGCEAHAAAASAPAAGAPAPGPRPDADPGPAAAHSAVRTAVPPPHGALHCCQGLKRHTVLVHPNALRGPQSQMRPR